MVMQSARRGFAMPMVIMVIGVMTAAVLAAFSRTGSEIQTVDNHRLQTRAFSVAEAGLHQFLANGRVNVTTRTYTYGNATASVTAREMRPRPLIGTEDAIWVVSSTSTVPGGVGRAPVRRTVAQFATLPRTGMKVTSALTSLNGVIKSGSSGSFIGADECAAQGTLPGSQIPSGGMWSGSSTMVAGTPPIDSTMTQTQLLANTGIDWAAVINTAGPAITPDVIICGTGATGAYGPCSPWPSFTDPNYWPVILIDGSTTLSVSGRGTIIATQDLELGGNVHWDGIMLVGGVLRDNGSGSQDGATIAGLNLLIPGGGTGGYSADMNGTKRFQFNSCNVANAAANFVRLVPITNAWVDNWASW